MAADKSATLYVEVTGLEPFKALLSTLTELHQPIDEEAEFWSDDETATEHDERWPDCPGYPNCEGHTATILVCGECGYDHDGDRAVFRSWPCPTIKALMGQNSEGGS